jgi:formylglycine-generating enzyme required for sulfatase activity
MATLPRVIRTVKDNAEALLLPAGEYRIGTFEDQVQETIRKLGEKNDPIFHSELPRQVFTLKDIYIDRVPVTNARYAEFMKAMRWPDPLYWLDKRYNQPDMPVVGISYRDARAYAEWAGKRLPTEEEWEAAARGLDERIWPWGNEFHPRRCNSREAGLGRPAPVGSFPAGMGPFGTHDMAGNVWELTSSAWEHMGKVIRGGSYQNSAAYCRGSCRWAMDPDLKGQTWLGFRCVMDLAKARIYGKPVA